MGRMGREGRKRRFIVRFKKDRKEVRGCWNVT